VIPEPVKPDSVTPEPTNPQSVPSEPVKAEPVPAQPVTPPTPAPLSSQSPPRSAQTKRIFITGGSGCIGHYIAESLIDTSDHELFFLIRNPDKVQFDLEARPGVHIIHGDMNNIEDQAKLLKTIDIAILTANAWGGAREVFDVNVAKTHQLIKLLDPDRCQQILYFSTASILNRENKLLEQAKQIGTEYIRSKYNCYAQLTRSRLADKITVLFPTLVFGGSSTKPYSHISGGLAEVSKWIGLARFFKADASFHYLHGRDIAAVVRHLVDHPLAKDVQNELNDIPLKQVILGNPALTVNNAIRELCTYFGKTIFFQVNVSLGLANVLINLFRIQMAAWDRFCLEYRHFTYQNPVNPATFGLPVFCPTLSDIFLATGIKGKRIPPSAPVTAEPSPNSDVEKPDDLE
jgi:nucleoside-diphosphate-sugar epimerase